MPAKATLSPQASHAITCYKRLMLAERKVFQANKTAIWPITSLQ